LNAKSLSMVLICQILVYHNPPGRGSTHSAQQDLQGYTVKSGLEASGEVGSGRNQVVNMIESSEKCDAV